MTFLTKYFRLLRIPCFYSLSIAAALILTLYAFLKGDELLQLFALAFAAVHLSNYVIANLYFNWFVNDLTKDNTKSVEISSILTQYSITASFIVLCGVGLAYSSYALAAMYLAMVFFEFATFKRFEKAISARNVAIVQQGFPKKN